MTPPHPTETSSPRITPPPTPDAAPRSFRRIAVTLFVAYMLFAIVMYLWLGVTFKPDMWLIALFVGAVVLGQTVSFLRDWIPFVFLIFGYELLRGVAGNIVVREGFSPEDHGRIQVQSLIDADRFLFNGTIPTLWLQEHLYTPGNAHWYDVMAVLLYGLHFVFPLIFAFLLWIGNRERFWQFSLSFLAMTYAGFAVFLLFPAAPPWLAQEWGYISGIQLPSNDAFQAILPQRYGDVPTFNIWTQASPNPVAAMPSLHAAFPWLVLLFSVRFFGKRGWIFLVYNAALWFSIVYLAHHWVIDVVAGMVWATIWFALVLVAWPWISRGASIPRPARLNAAGRKLHRTLPAPFQRSPDQT